ncbi:hypothetical protein V498_02910 [Pseudogymnoascus sp. VKM F-4517 (FW-2822)]|nr:hypothetical protein V498_02910 [Pseudogymnoascus sp. VKM F-4517 (FW-2822)]
MKAKVLAVVSALAAVIVAAPQQLQTSLNKVALPPDVAGSTIFEDPCWRYSNNKGTASHPCWTCCKAPTINDAETPPISTTTDKEEIDINIKISDTSAAVSASSLFEDYWTASHPCWTCCKAPAIDDATADHIISTPSEEDIEIDVQIGDIDPAMSAASLFADICWKICLPQKPNCPHGWHSKRFGHCWTCCRTTDASTPSGEDTGFNIEADMEMEMEIKLEVDMEDDMEAETEADEQTSELIALCRRRCYRSRPRCHRGWYPVRRGRCWRCCRGGRATPSVDDTPGEEITSDVQIVDTTAANSDSHILDMCWRYSNNRGTAEHPCWTCCKAPTDDAATSQWLGLRADL